MNGFTSQQLLTVLTIENRQIRSYDAAIELALKALLLLAEIIPEADYVNALAFEKLMDEAILVMNEQDWTER